MNSIKLKVLIENRVDVRGLYAEHGLSLLIENDKDKMLFDTGASERFIANARMLKIDLNEIRQVVISHGHDDHAGGLAAFVEINNHAKIILKKEALAPKFSRNKSIGIDKSLNTNNSRFQYINSVLELTDGIFAVPVINRNHFPDDTHFEGFKTIVNESEQTDQFDDELFFIIKKGNKMSIVTACSHNGILNIIATAKDLFPYELDKVVGGFHLKNTSDGYLDELAAKLEQLDVRKIYTNHCTGVHSFALLKQKMKIPVHYLETGKHLIFND